LQLLAIPDTKLAKQSVSRVVVLKKNYIFERKIYFMAAGYTKKQEL
jgi:hypothetical protein